MPQPETQVKPSPEAQPNPTQSPPETVKPAEPAWRISLREAKVAATAAAGAILLAIALALAAAGLDSQALGMATGVSVLAAVVLSGWTSVRCLLALGRMAFAREPIGAKEWLSALGLGAAAAFGMFLAFFGLMGAARGRQLRKNGRVLLPPLTPEGGWSGLLMEAHIPETERLALAARWRENGRTEHASVAAFARLTLDLMALGAPPALIYAANRDAKDEIRHTELCFSLAKALDGRDVGPGPFPEAQEAHSLPKNRSLALAKLAVDSLLDGALHEGLSARILSLLQPRCSLPAIRALQRELAIDESRHSAHGWDVVAWCLAEGGAPVAQALRGAAEMVPAEHKTDLPPEAQGGAWEAFGIQGEALEREQYRRCRESVRRMVAAMTAVKGRSETRVLAAA